MTEPWFDLMSFGAYAGGIGGGVLGSLVGLLGALTGILAPRGKGRSFLYLAWSLLTIIGLGCLVIGIIALISRQPWIIWYVFLLVGFIVGGLSIMALGLTRSAFRMIEARRMAAAEIRSGMTGL